MHPRMKTTVAAVVSWDSCPAPDQSLTATRSNCPASHYLREISSVWPEGCYRSATGCSVGFWRMVGPGYVTDHSHQQASIGAWKTKKHDPCVDQKRQFHRCLSPALCQRPVAHPPIASSTTAPHSSYAYRSYPQRPTAPRNSDHHSSPLSTLPHGADSRPSTTMSSHSLPSNATYHLLLSTAMHNSV